MPAKGVAELAQAVAGEVLEAHAGRLVRRTALITALVVLAVVLPVIALVRHELKAASSANCEVSRTEARLELAKGKSETARTIDFERRSRDRLGLTPAGFAALIGSQQAEQRARVRVYSHLERRNCS